MGLLTFTTSAQSWITNGLVAYYPFNGNANDASGYQNNPVMNTATLTTNRFGLANSAYSFSGNQQIQYASQSQLEKITNLTVSCWVSTTNGANNYDNCCLHGIVCKAIPTDPMMAGFQLGYGLEHVNAECDATTYAATALVNDGQWHLLCAVFDHQNGRLNIFIDGKTDSTYNTPVNTLAVQNQLSIGIEREGNYFFTGSIDDVRIYNRALSTNEVAQLYAMESTPIVNIQKAVYLTSNNLWAGTNYQVQASTDLINWTNQGSVFTATNSTWHSTNYWDVANWNQLFFRLQQQ